MEPYVRHVESGETRSKTDILRVLESSTQKAKPLTGNPYHYDVVLELVRRLAWNIPGEHRERCPRA
jgi:hypothetical protein